MPNLKTQSRSEFDEVTGQWSQLMGKLWQWHVGEFSPGDSWSPSVNVYKMPRHIEVCVDLAGLDKETIDVRVEPGKLIIRGVRASPEPATTDNQTMRILCMEIDHGPFCRVIGLPDQVDLARVESHYDQGLLWVKLPLRVPG